MTYICKNLLFSVVMCTLLILSGCVKQQKGEKIEVKSWNGNEVTFNYYNYTSSGLWKILEEKGYW